MTTSESIKEELVGHEELKTEAGGFHFQFIVNGKRLYIKQYWLDRMLDTSAFRKVVGSMVAMAGGELGQSRYIFKMEIERDGHAKT